MAETDSWPGSDVERATLADSVGVFLRTHKNGWGMLIDWLASIPPDRTEPEYAEGVRSAGPSGRASASVED
jgi:hypothetical protein